MLLNSIAVQASGSDWGNFIMIPLMFFVIYFFMIRPQVRRQTGTAQQRGDELQGNDRVTSQAPLQRQDLPRRCRRKGAGQGAGRQQNAR